MSAPAVEKGRLARSKAGRDKGRLCVVVRGAWTKTSSSPATAACAPLTAPRRSAKSIFSRSSPVQEEIADGRTIEDHTLRAWIREEEEKLVQV